MSIKSEVREEIDRHVEKQRLESLNDDLRKIGVFPNKQTDDDFYDRALGGFHDDF